VNLSCDVLIVGAGLAGATLARQLRLEQPGLDIVVVDKAIDFHPGMDEAMGEEFANYANRVLGLGGYLRKAHIVCSGTRFFFDTADRDATIDRMSEIGRREPHPLPTYFIDRPAVERELARLNRESGVRVLLGTTVQDVLTVDGTRGHRVATTAGVVTCRWLVDAAGVDSPFMRRYDTTMDDEPGTLTAVWGRIDGCRPLDTFGPKSWRKRVPHWGRESDMVQFCYRGYWMWLMPISATEFSVGVVTHRAHVRPELTSPEELLDFLREHQAMRDVLGESPVLTGFGRRDVTPRMVTHQFTADRWFVTGHAATVLDPMFATSSWVLAENNKLIGDFIAADLAGREERFPALLHHYDIRAHSRYRKMVGTAGRYAALGSFDAWSAWLALRTRVYYNRIVPDAMEDHRVLLTFAHSHGVDCDCAEVVLEGILARLLLTVDRLTEELVATLDQDGTTTTANSGIFLDSKPFDQDPELIGKVHLRRDWRVERTVDRQNYAVFCRTVMRRLMELRGQPWHEAAFTAVFAPDWDDKQTLADLYSGMLAWSP
jgi:flavin-dependent dehydrogenase